MTHDQPNNIPTNKVAAGGVAGSLTIVLVYILGLANVQLPPEVASAITVLISFGAAYLTKERV